MFACNELRAGQAGRRAASELLSLSSQHGSSYAAENGRAARPSAFGTFLQQLWGKAALLPTSIRARLGRAGRVWSSTGARICTDRGNGRAQGREYTALTAQLFHSLSYPNFFFSLSLPVICPLSFRRCFSVKRIQRAQRCLGQAERETKEQ